MGAALLAKDACFPDLCATQKMYHQLGTSGVLSFCDQACGVLNGGGSSSGSSSSGGGGGKCQFILNCTS